MASDASIEPPSDASRSAADSGDSGSDPAARFSDLADRIAATTADRRRQTTPLDSAAAGSASAGSTDVDPAGVDPAGVDPAGVDPVDADAAGVDPVDADAAGADSAGVDPVGVDPAGADAAGADPAGVDPVGADAAGVDTATAENIAAADLAIDTVALDSGPIAAGSVAPDVDPGTAQVSAGLVAADLERRASDTSASSTTEAHPDPLHPYADGGGGRDAAGADAADDLAAGAGEATGGDAPGNGNTGEASAEDQVRSSAHLDPADGSGGSAEGQGSGGPVGLADGLAGAAGTDGPERPADGAGSGADAVQPELDELADPDRLRSAVEAVLLVVDTPTSSMTLAQVLGRSVPEVDAALRALRDDYDAGGRGMDLREVADGWRLYSRDEFAVYVERFVLDGQQARLTQAALETLAVIAYRQPVTRSRISGIRGVSVDAVMRTLLTRGLVEECGADPDTGGGLYRTTRLFLEKLGLRSLDELPSLAPLLPDTSQLDDVELST